MKLTSGFIPRKSNYESANKPKFSDKFKAYNAKNTRLRRFYAKTQSEASLAQLKATAIFGPLSLLSIVATNKYNKNLAPESIEILENAAINAVNNGKLKDVVNFSFIEPVKAGLKDKVASFFIPIVGPELQTKYGMNAFFDDAKGRIVVPKGKMALTSFHEMGHAMNFNFSNIGKSLQKVRTPLMFGALMFSMYIASTLRNKPAEKAEDGSEQKKKGIFTKITDKLANNAGKIAGLLYVPIIAEEALASFKGNKIAQEALKEFPELIKKVKISNAIALTSYITSALLLASVAHAGVKAKDKSLEKHRAEFEP